MISKKDSENDHRYIRGLKFMAGAKLYDILHKNKKDKEVESELQKQVTELQERLKKLEEGQK